MPQNDSIAVDADTETESFDKPSDGLPTYAQATTIIPTTRGSYPRPNRLTINTLRTETTEPTETSFGSLIPVLATVAIFTTIMGIAESVSYAVYYSPFHLLLPIQSIFVPIIGGGPVQVILAVLAFACSRFHSRYMQALCAFILTVSILCGLAIPITSIVVNQDASSDTTAIVAALQAAPMSVLNDFSAMYQSCTYNIPSNDTTYTVLDIVPQYRDKSCPYSAIVCNIPVQLCIYTYKAYTCTDVNQLQSQEPCNTLARVAYQISYDWNKIGKMVDAWAMGVWGFWFIVLAIVFLRSWLAGF